MGKTISRRQLGGVLAAIGAIATAEGAAQDASPVATPAAASDLYGVAGGGTLSQMGVDVPFSVMAFSIPGAEGAPRTGGFLRLVDASTPDHPIVLDATGILSVGPLSAQSTAGRQVTGIGTLNGRGRYPFMLQIEDLGEPGSGKDTFNLVFGEAALPFLTGVDKAGCDCGGLGYSIRSNVIAGDLSLMSPE